MLSNSWINVGQILTGDEQRQAYAQARVAADREEVLAPDAAVTHSDRGYLMEVIDNDPVGALTEYQRAYALAPNVGTVMSFLAHGLENLGQLQPAIELHRKAIATDPLRPDFHVNLATSLLAQGQLDAAEQATRKAQALQPDYPELYSMLAQIDILRGDAAAAVRDAQQETDCVIGPLIRAMAQQIHPDHEQAGKALHGYIAKYEKDQPYFVADLYALRKQPVDMFEWLQRASAQHDPTLYNALLSDPFVLPYQHDPRFAALRKQAGLAPLGGAVAAPAATR